MKISRGYAAGILDGEGSITFGRNRGRIFARVLIVNTNRPLLEAFQEQFGGDIKPISGRRPGWKQAWMWRIQWARAVEFVAWVYRELRVKDEQARTIFAWDAIRLGHGNLADQDAHDLLARRMKWLNQRGPRATPDPILAELR